MKCSSNNAIMLECMYNEKVPADARIYVGTSLIHSFKLALLFPVQSITL